MEPNELPGLSQFQEDLDGFSDRIFQSLDILARALHVKNAELEPALQAIVSTAVTTLSSAQHAGLITVSRGTLIPQATTGRPPQLLDQLQQKLNDGPCIDAAVQQTLIRIEDTHRESRWPDFAAEAESLGVCSMLCVPLRVHERCLGTLSLYSEPRHAIHRPRRARHDAVRHPGRHCARRGAADRPAACRARQPGRDRPGQGHLDGTAPDDRRSGLQKSVPGLAEREHKADIGRQAPR